jgi:hypothetical protein
MIKLSAKVVVCFIYFWLLLQPLVIITPVDSIKKVFISYSTKDREWVKDYLLKNLEDNGISCQIKLIQIKKDNKVERSFKVE